jgi:hypothetical protein
MVLGAIGTLAILPRTAIVQIARSCNTESLPKGGQVPRFRETSLEKEKVGYVFKCKAAIGL